MAAPLQIDLVVEGTAAQERRLKGISEMWPKAYAGALYMAATNVVSTAMKLTPVETGFLRKSRFVRRPRFSGAMFFIEIGFSAPYAVFVHEIQKNYVVGEWKFLATAVNWHATSMFSDIARWSAALIAKGHGIDDVPATHPTEPTTEKRPRSIFARRDGESLSAQIKRNGRLRARWATGLQNNRERVAREVAASFDAARAGRRAPRPGRGG